MEERIKISDVKWLQTELEKIESRLSALEASRGVPSLEDVVPITPCISATPQPVRIRPEWQMWDEALFEVEFLDHSIGRFPAKHLGYLVMPWRVRMCSLSEQLSPDEPAPEGPESK